jgi:iron complex outermembrane receptor protein
MYVDGYKGPPSYDVGLMFRLKGFDLMFSRKKFQIVQQCTTYHGGYDYDRYDPVFDVKPGYGTEETHMELGYTRQLGNFHLNGSVYSDWYCISHYEVSYDSLVATHPKVEYETWDYVVDENGNIQYETNVEFGLSDFTQNREHTMGGILKASTDYRIGKMNGNVMAGAQYEHFKLLSRISMWNKEFSKIDGGYLSISSITEDGKENSLSFFVQDKHYILPQLILNAGCRYDFKYRHKEDVVRTLSPRLALMYVPNDRFSLKLSYAEAFADLSFFFRWASSSGDDKIKMDPQHLSAIQLTAMGSIPSLHMNYDVNLFYNKYANLFCWEARDVDLISYDGKNDGRLTNIGIEGTASYAYKRLSANLSLYYCHDTSSEHYYYNTVEKIVNNVPHFTLNLHGAYKLLQGNNHQLKVYGHSSYTGRMLNFVTQKENEDFYVDAKVIFDLGIQYRFRQRLQFSLDCENIFNTDHYICGPNSHNLPYFQRGRSLMASLSYNF